MFEDLKNLYCDLESTDLSFLVTVAANTQDSDFEHHLRRRQQVMDAILKKMPALDRKLSAKNLSQIKKMHAESLSRGKRVMQAVSQLRDEVRDKWVKISGGGQSRHSPYAKTVSKKRIKL